VTVQRADVDRVAQAVLYEGYLLWPYRPSATKNRVRWTFGAVFPPGYSGAGGPGEPSTVTTECLLETTASTAIEAEVRFLHPVQVLRAADGRQQAWQEAVEARATIAAGSVAGLALAPREVAVERLPYEHTEPASGDGTLIHCQALLRACAHLSVLRLDERLARVSVSVRNVTDIAAADAGTRERAVLHAMASCHVVLVASGGRWLSQADPPDAARAAAARCRNEGLWPVIVGDADDVVLASPIILEDHPRVAPESPGDLCDSSEIDELLSLSILALTDSEKAEVRAGDARARAILERTERLDPAQLLRLHGARRRPAADAGA
jgi:hydrogenase maturation protease